MKKREMFRVFNMGVGMILVASPDDANDLLAELGEGAWALGQVTPTPGVELEGL